MKRRTLIDILFCSIALAGISGRVLRAEQPATPADAQKANQPVRSLPNVTTTYDVPIHVTLGNRLNLVTATYGNALGIEITDADPALRAQLGVEEGVGT